MKTVLSENVIPFDVDETLIMHSPAFVGGQSIKCPYLGEKVTVWPHEPHIKLLKEKKARGYFIVVWSAGGAAWAEEVIYALGISEFVDLVLTKPNAYVDDKNASEWLTERIYIEASSKWKTL